MPVENRSKPVCGPTGGSKETLSGLLSPNSWIAGCQCGAKWRHLRLGGMKGHDPLAHDFPFMFSTKSQASCTGPWIRSSGTLGI